MKHVFTVSLDGKTIEKIMAHKRKKSFANKSRLVEEAILTFIEGKEGKNQEEEK